MSENVKVGSERNEMVYHVFSGGYTEKADGSGNPIVSDKGNPRMRPEGKLAGTVYVRRVDSSKYGEVSHPGSTDFPHIPIEFIRGTAGVHHLDRNHASRKVGRVVAQFYVERAVRNYELFDELRRVRTESKLFSSELEFSPDTVRSTGFYDVPEDSDGHDSFVKQKAQLGLDILGVVENARDDLREWLIKESAERGVQNHSVINHLSGSGFSFETQYDWKVRQESKGTDFISKQHLGANELRYFYPEESKNQDFLERTIGTPQEVEDDGVTRIVAPAAPAARMNEDGSLDKLPDQDGA